MQQNIETNIQGEPHQIARHFGSCKPGLTRRNTTQRSKQSNPLSWAGQYKKCIQYDFKFTPELEIRKKKTGYCKPNPGHDTRFTEFHV